MDIKRKITENNVMDEAFSSVTAGWVLYCEISSQGLTHSLSQEELMDLLWDLLIAKSNTPNMAVLIRDKIGDISPESPSHRVGVLKVAMKKKFELEKQKGQYTGVRLICPNWRCTRYSNHVSISEIERAVTCRLCFSPGSPPFHFLCNYCQFCRTVDTGKCQGCGLRFQY